MDFSMHLHCVEDRIDSLFMHMEAFMSCQSKFRLLLYISRQPLQFSIIKTRGKIVQLLECPTGLPPLTL